MDLNHTALLRLQEFVACVDQTMNAVPLPVPPAPEGTWDGDLLLARHLYLAYSRLPAKLQEAAAYGYTRCLHALEAQTDAAHHALIARYAVFADLSRRTGFTPGELCPDLRRRGERPYLTLVRDDDHHPDHPDDDDPDQALRQALLATVAAHHQAANPDDPAPAADESVPAADESVPADPVADDDPARPCQPAAAAADDLVLAETAPASRRVPVMIGAAVALAAAALAVLAVVAWPRSTHTPAPARPAARLLCVPEPSDASPAAVAATTQAEATTEDATASAPATSAFTIDRAAQDGDFGVVVSHGERIGKRTHVHVHMLNAGDQPHRADITIHDGDRDTPAASETIPPRSSRHRVIEVDDVYDPDVSVSVGGLRVDGILGTQ